MIDIKPFEILFKGTAVKLAILCNGYWIGKSESASFSASLLKEVKEKDVIKYEEIHSQSMNMEGDDFAKWGSDDQYAIDWVLSQLKLEKA